MDSLEILKERIKNIPQRHGCYLWKNSSLDQPILYVGKAINLRSRVRSYFNAKDIKTKVLMQQINDIDWIVTDNEVEALLLESNLIKKYNPHYNIRLKDDKRYPYICLTSGEIYPRLIITRKKHNLNHKYFGPFADVGAARNTMATLHKIFPIRKRPLKLPLKKPAKPCLNFHIQKCWAPCTGQVSQNEYDNMVTGIIDFLNGQSESVQKNLQEEMKLYAKELQYEKAARIKNVLEDLNIVIQNRQKVHSENDNTNYDIVSIASLNSYQLSEQSPGIDFSDINGNALLFSQAVLLQIRNGNLIGKRSFALNEMSYDACNRQKEIDVAGIYQKSDGDTHQKMTTETNHSKVDPEYIEGFFRDYYLQFSDIPPLIITSTTIENKKIWQILFTQKIKEKVAIVDSIKSKKVQAYLSLIQLAASNAELSLKERVLSEKIRNKRAGLKQIKKFLRLKTFPQYIECYDISNIQGKEAVASGIMFKDGLPHKAGYRKYKIKGLDTPNDPAMIAEVINRRLKTSIEKNFKLPDLILIDGGITQLRAAISERDKLKLKVTIASLAKQEEEIYLEDGEVLNLENHSPAMLILRHARDEAHRFAVAYHRNLRQKRNMKSTLDDIAGIGEVKKEIVIDYLRKINVEETDEKILITNLSKLNKISQQDAKRIAKVVLQ